MKPDSIHKRLCTQMQVMGYYSTTVSITHLPEIETELIERHDQDSFDEEFFQEQLTSFQFHPASILTKAETIIVVAVPQPTVVVNFRWHGVDQLVVIPPTYDVSVDAKLKKHLEQILQPEGYHLASTNLPLKLLAVRSGLAVYGRNNICYIPGKGSFYRYVAFISDLPCTEDHWESPVILERCAKCKACIISCPSHAIGEQRFLLQAERCLTFHNEHAKDIPEYVDQSWHHCLFGCLVCQKICPENKETIKWVVERERFSEDETAIILHGVPLPQIPLSTRQKLERLCLIADYSLLARNLSLVVI